MKKDYLIYIFVGLAIFGYVLDFISGPVSIPLNNPYEFLNQEVFSIYPLTAVSIAAKTLAIIIAAPVLLSFLKGQYVLKSIIMFVLAAILALYSIQQLATGLAITPIQWTLSFAFSGVGLLIPCVIFLIIGLLSGTKKVIGDDNGEDFKL